MVIVTSLLVAGALGSVAGGVSADSGARRAARKTKREARRQAALIREESLFQANRLGEQTRRVRASQIAGVGASGVQQTGSAEAVAMETLAQSTLEQSRILEGAGRQRSATLAAASNRASALRSQGRSALIGGISRGISGLASAFAPTPDKG